MILQLRDIDYVDRLKALKLPSTQSGGQAMDMIQTCKIVTSRMGLDPTLVFFFSWDKSRHYAPDIETLWSQ